MMNVTRFLMGLALLCALPTTAQVNDEQFGAWYMYFYDWEIGESRFGLQGDVQYRNWDLGGDLEQLLLRSGLTYRPKETNVKLTLGYGNITSGAFGESNATSTESRIYQEALLPHKIRDRIRLKHRFRYEQRFVEGQDLRTRYRYNLFLTIPITTKLMDKGGWYLSLYNELFINGQKSIGEGRSVEFFDRNRLYGAIGYVLSEKLKVQAGLMRQSLNNLGKDQMQVSLHQTW